MTYVDPNSGAVAQPGAAIYRGPEAEADRLAEAEEKGVEVAELEEPVAEESEDDGNARLPQGDESEEDAEEEASAPAKSASKGDWVDYAVSQGADREEAEESTKEQLIEAYGA